MSGLLTDILNNVKVTINNVHVRFEDAVTNAAIGLTIKQINLRTTDENGRDVFASQGQLELTKELTIGDLAVYCDTFYTPLSSASKETQIAYLKNTISSAQGLSTDLSYVVHPMQVVATMKIDKSPPSQIKKAKLQIQTKFDSFHVSASSSQINVMLRSFQRFLQFGSKQRRMHLRPMQEPSKAPGAWLRYLFNSYDQAPDNT